VAIILNIQSRPIMFYSITIKI